MPPNREVTSETLTSLLPPDLLGHCLSFVGKGQYRFVAGTCKELRRVYAETIDPKRRTTWTNACESIKLAQFCLSDVDRMTNGRPTMLQHVFLRNLRLSATRIGRLPVVQWAHERDMLLTSTVGGLDEDFDEFERIRVAAISAMIDGIDGNEGVVHRILREPDDRVSVWITRTCEAAATSGHVRVLECLHDRGFLWFPWKWCEKAARNGHLEALKFLYEHGGNLISLWSCVDTAAKNGHVHILQYFLEQGFEFDIDMATSAAHTGDLSVLQFLHENDIEFNARLACNEAASKGKLNAVQYLCENGYDIDAANASMAAVQGGHTNVVRYLFEDYGCDATWAFRGAVHTGYLDVVKCIHETGCAPLYALFSCQVAAGRGHLEVLKYLSQIGFEWDRDACIASAERNGHSLVAQWLRDQTLDRRPKATEGNKAWHWSTDAKW